MKRHILRDPLLVFVLSLVAMLSNPASGVQIEVDFSSSTDQALFQLNGSAQFINNRLRLTPAQSGQAGSAFFQQGLLVNPSADFRTHFQFQISGANDPTMRSDGLAFVVQGVSSEFLGNAGGNLGYIGGPHIGNFDTYAVEFDIHQNTGDISDNEIAITRLRADGMFEVLASRSLTELGFPLLDDGAIKDVVIDYSFHGQDRLLRVFLSPTPGTIPQLITLAVLPTDLFQFGGDSTYFGFTAATGDGFANHDILGFSSIEVPEPPTLVLLTMGALSLIHLLRRTK